MKRIVFPFLGMLMLVTSGCIKKGDNIGAFTDEPAIVRFNYDFFLPTLVTRWGAFVAPELQSKFFTEINEGDLLWTHFEVNYDQQSSTEYLVVSGLQYGKIDQEGWPSATPGGESVTGDFNVPIEGMILYTRIENYLFFLFGHMAPTGQKFTYEMTYDPEPADTKVLYLRAKKTGEESTKTKELFPVPFAFYMGSFFSEYKGADNKVNVSFRFKIEDDEAGNEQYYLYMDQYGRSIFSFEVE